MTEYAEILAGPDFFDCKRQKGRLLKTLYVKYQTGRPYPRGTFGWQGGTYVRECCGKCKQGEGIAQERREGDI